jgi:hypothetical protein
LRKVDQSVNGEENQAPLRNRRTCRNNTHKEERALRITVPPLQYHVNMLPSLLGPDRIEVPRFLGGITETGIFRDKHVMTISFFG